MGSSAAKSSIAVALASAFAVLEWDVLRSSGSNGATVACIKPVSRHVLILSSGASTVNYLFDAPAARNTYGRHRRTEVHARSMPKRWSRRPRSASSAFSVFPA